MKAFIFAMLLVASMNVGATKPCVLPCLLNGEFDREQCLKTADWIATGRIDSITHDVVGYPLNKDFASFTLHVVSWDKGEIPEIDKLRFKVGWCDNPQELPQDTSGEFRFYGVVNRYGQQEVIRYLYFEPVGN